MILGELLTNWKSFYVIWHRQERILGELFPGLFEMYDQAKMAEYYRRIPDQYGISYFEPTRKENEEYWRKRYEREGHRINDLAWDKMKDAVRRLSWKE